nr:DEAD/DEAH box helicase [Pontiella sulfatireligans]
MFGCNLLNYRIQHLETFIMQFTDLGLGPDVLAGIAKLGFETPTPVQAEVIPFLLKSEQDLVALAQTGTGKTAAFGLPLLEMLDVDRVVPQALVLCPTRELCKQITHDIAAFAAGMSRVKVQAVYGGAEISSQLLALDRGVHIVVATPGRMVDLLERECADFSQINHVVLDEADVMLNMGFEEDLNTILSSVPEKARVFLFSATMPREVARIAKNYMQHAHEITVGSRNAGSEGVSHEYCAVHAKDRYRALRRIVDAQPDMYGIIFCRTRLETQQVADNLRRDGYSAEPLHGDLSQQARDGVMKKFRGKQIPLLVATDVAARGLDVNDLTHVINYNLPDDLSTYTHRSGRTGRAGKSGISIAIIHQREYPILTRIESELGKKFTQRLVPTGSEIAESRLMSLACNVRDFKSGPGLIDQHIDQMVELLADVPKDELIKRFASLDLAKLLLYYRDSYDLNENVGTGAAHAQRNKNRQ